jgi:hypothetical protein
MKFDLVRVNIPQVQPYKAKRITNKVILIGFITQACPGVKLMYLHNGVMMSSFPAYVVHLTGFGF